MTAHVLDFYKAIERTSSAMLTAALLEDWDEVVRLEGVCAVLIEQLRERCAQRDLTAEEHAEKHKIMLSILRHDAQIRSLAEPWIEELDASMALRRPTRLH